MSENLNEVFTIEFADASVITVPIDDTLSNSGEAADAAAVGAALALKANAADIANIKVNDEQADNQGQILLYGTDVPMSDSDDTTLKAAIEAAAGRTAADIPMASNDSTKISAKISAVETMAGRTGADIPLTGALGAPSIAEAIGTVEDAVLSVNGEEPDENGNVSLSRVDIAGNLETSFKQTSAGSFLQRTTGGGASVVSGDSQLMSIQGNSVRTGFTAEVLQMVVNGANISATIDRDDWVDAVSESGTTVFSYTSSWSPTPGDYGITVSGSPSNGNTITVVYVKEVRGTITNATPTQFCSTGWNLYSNANGYAKVVRYSNDYGYMITGAYTAVQFSATLNGTKTTITPTQTANGGMFQVPDDGYVWVTGGDGSTTAIFPTWSDWTEGYPGSFETYSRSTISLSAVMASYFPYGLYQVGTVRDEINLQNSQAISRIDRMSYTAENLATAKSSGRDYIYDENYIYLVKASASVNTIDVSNTFTANDHGIEYFDGSAVPVYAQTNYSANLRNKLERDTLTISQQTLTDDQKAQVRSNIGAVNAADLEEIDIGAETLTLLWENPSPSASFAAGDINIDMTGYDGIAIALSGPSPLHRLYFVNGEMDLYATSIKGVSGNSFFISARKFTVNSALTKITAGTGCYVYRDGGNGTGNTHCIPYKIFGINKKQTI